MKLVTVATHSERYYPYLQLSAKKYGHELITLGWGEKWQGFAWKFDLMKQYLESVQSDEIVCFIDGYDVVVLEDSKTIERKYMNAVKNDTSKVFISKEQYSHSGVENTILSYLQSFIYTKCENEYINTGTYMGIASTLLSVIENLCTDLKCSSTSDDQRRMQDYCTKHSDKFIIDHECSVFLVINSTISKIKEGEYDISFIDNTLVYKQIMYPAFFHGNGYTDFDYIIEKLGYDTTIFKADNESKSKFVKARILGFIPAAFERLWAFILIFIFIVIFIVIRIHKYRNKSSNRLGKSKRRYST